ncbi:hypothetical protein D3C87_1209820 [compost metagenome]
MMKAGVKALKASIVWITALKKITGVNSGSVMRKNCRILLAPSISAASYISCGICRSPARKMIIGEPNCQTDRITSV